jgi:hypothetical protein
MSYLDRYNKPPAYDRASGQHYQDYLHELGCFETKIYAPLLRGPLFAPPAAVRVWKKKVRSLQRLAARKLGESLPGGVVQSLKYLQEYPCPHPVIQLTHKFIHMSKREWFCFIPVERFWRQLDPGYNRIKRVCDYYRALYPDKDYDEDVDALLALL